MTEITEKVLTFCAVFCSFMITSVLWFVVMTWEEISKEARHQEANHNYAEQK